MSAGRVSWLEAIAKRRHELVLISPESGEILPAAGAKKRRFYKFKLVFQRFSTLNLSDFSKKFACGLRRAKKKQNPILCGLYQNLKSQKASRPRRQNEKRDTGALIRHPITSEK